jgi:hypothetical protein
MREFPSWTLGRRHTNCHAIPHSIVFYHRSAYPQLTGWPIDTKAPSHSQFLTTVLTFAPTHEYQGEIPAQ